MRVFVVAAVLALAVGCAYVGEPLPPALHVPRPITALAVEQVGEQVRVRFPLPVETTEAIGLEIRAIEVRAEWPGGGEKMLAATRAEQQGVASASATAPVKPWAGQAVTLKARTQSKQGKWSEWSPAATIQVEEAVPTPAEVKAEAAPTGVRLSWRVGEGGAGGATMRIERRAETAKAFGEGATVAVGDGAWVDTQARFGEKQHYRLTAVSASGAARSDTVEAEVTPEDTFAPSVPAGLTVVPGLGSIELSWDRPPEADLVGFAIYRAGPEGEFTRLNTGPPIGAASYSDRAVKGGTKYRYAVSSIDQKGNESARCEPVEITAPN